MHRWLSPLVCIFLVIASACTRTTVVSPTPLAAPATSAPTPLTAATLTPTALAPSPKPTSSPSAVPTPSPSPAREMAAAEVGGLVEMQLAGSTSWQALPRGQKLGVGDQLRTGEGAFVLLRLTDQSSYVVGPESLAALERLTPGLADPTTTLFLQAGSALAVAQQTRLGNGAFEIKTPRLIVSLIAPRTSSHGAPKLASLVNFPSGYVGSGIVTIEPGVPADQARTQVGCLSGNCSVTLAKTGTSSRLDFNQYVEITVGDPDNLRPIPPELQAEAQRLGAYTMSQLIALLTGTPPALVRVPPKVTATVTPPATWTAFLMLPEATATLTPLPVTKHRAATPDPNWTPPMAGLTPEENANLGAHVFDHTCRPYGKCVCSESGDTPKIAVAFDQSGVTLSGGDGGAAGAITYPKVGPNLYTLKSQGLEASLMFFIDGWDFVVTKNGAACSLQTFLLK